LAQGSGWFISTTSYNVLPPPSAGFGMARFSALVSSLVLAQVAVAVLPPAATSDRISILQQPSQPALPDEEVLQGLNLEQKGPGLNLAQSEQEFEDNARVMIRLESGKYEGTWVPAWVHEMTFPGFYDAVVELGPADRYFTIIRGVRSPLLKRAESKIGHNQDIQFYVSHETQAKQVVDDLEKDAHKRTVNSLLAKGLSKMQVAAKLETLEAMALQKKVHAIRAKGCPLGYKAVVGDVKGANRYPSNGMINKQDGIDLCAKECKLRNRCQSFQWSPSSKVCHVNKIAQPEIPAQLQDYMFCTRVINPPAQ